MVKRLNLPSLDLSRITNTSDKKKAKSGGESVLWDDSIQKNAGVKKDRKEDVRGKHKPHNCLRNELHHSEFTIRISEVDSSGRFSPPIIKSRRIARKYASCIA